MACEEQDCTVHVPPGFVHCRLPLPGLGAGGVGSTSPRRVLTRGTLLPLADSSLLNSAHLLPKIKFKSSDPALVAAGARQLEAQKRSRTVGSLVARQ